MHRQKGVESKKDIKSKLPAVVVDIDDSEFFHFTMAFVQ